MVLEARRQTGDRVAIGHVVLMADSSVPDREGTVAARFTSATGAALEFYAPGRAPVRTDVFDYCLPTCTPGPGNLAPDTLFTVRTAPPSQGALKLSLLAGGGRTAAAAALLCLIALMVAGSVRSRYLALAFAAAILIFTPAGTRLGLGSFFSPATYYLGAFDPLTASAGALWLTGVLALVASVVLRHRTLPARISLAVGVILLAATPPLAGILSTGIVPPPAGVGVGLWVGWEIPIAVFIAAMVLSWARSSRRRPSPGGGSRGQRRDSLWCAQCWACWSGGPNAAGTPGTSGCGFLPSCSLPAPVAGYGASSPGQSSRGARRRSSPGVR